MPAPGKGKKRKTKKTIESQRSQQLLIRNLIKESKKNEVDKKI